MLLPFGSRTDRSMSSPVRVALTRIVTTKSCFAGMMVRAKWSHVSSASAQLCGLETTAGPPDQVAVAESGEMVAPEGVAAITGEASKSTHRIQETISGLVRTVFGRVISIVYPFRVIAPSHRAHSQVLLRVFCNSPTRRFS